jgi:endo-1,4-beta-xylanase
MKHRLLIAVVAFLLVPVLILLKASDAPSASVPSPTPAAEISETSLRSLAQKRGFNIGAAVEVEPLLNDAKYRSVLASEFNVLVPENAWKFISVHPTRDRYDFSRVDVLMEFAKANNMKVRGHPLVWHSSLPRWLWLNEEKFTRDELIAILKDHVQTLVSRYRGQVFAWDVLNEAINRDGSLRDTIWLRNIGPEYIDLAFQWAHEADPDALLFYSDYGNDEQGRKPDAMYNMVRGMLQRGVPIHGVGLQAHRLVQEPPDAKALAGNMKRHADLGLQVQFTELDIAISQGVGSKEERLEEQGRGYGDIFKTCLSIPKCTGIITWGFTDRHTWLGSLTGQIEAPLLFDEEYRPKPAYEAIKKVLSSK